MPRLVAYRPTSNSNLFGFTKAAGDGLSAASFLFRERFLSLFRRSLKALDSVITVRGAGYKKSAGRYVPPLYYLGQGATGGLGGCQSSGA